ncbi:PilZ domain-containing protein [Stutzerimonas azotifigens]|uniref:PilZ domain-containing protein n=1 Tax=Stutzerimonas azotifigens TaxID=291995 RepID=UPI0004187C18|nr:PilZ domain-containing protein [Stutzerimonas azotifigens]
MSQRDRDYDEKRDFIRMRMDAGVILLLDEQRIEGVCLDLSSTGMQVEATSSLRMGDRVRVQIPSTHPSLRGLDADAEVVRVSALDQGRQRLGLAILEMR